MERENEHERHEQQQDDEMLTTEQVAHDLQISTQKLRHEYREHGWLLPIRLSKQTVRYTKEALEQFKKKHTINKKDEET